jgi:hypothetical protein
MTTPLLDGYGCAVGLMAITRPSKPTPLGMQTVQPADGRVSGKVLDTHLSEICRHNAGHPALHHFKL